MNRAITLLPSGSSPLFFMCSGGWLVSALERVGRGGVNTRLSNCALFFFFRFGWPGVVKQVMFYWH